MSVADFLYQYKLLDDSIEYDPELSFEDTIFNKKEFKDLILPRMEERPHPGDLLLHQRIIQRFLSSYAPYDELLLYHEVGTGKTCSAVGTIEQLRQENFGFQRALILVKGKPLIDNFINELVFVCTDGRYIPEDYESLTDMEKTIRTRKAIEDYYEFDTFEVFAKKIKASTDDQLRKKYNNTIIIVDEVHNLRPSDANSEEKNIYDEIHRFLHLLTNRKIMLMSATPMKDRSEEISTVMNLILPLDDQLPIDKKFAEKYLTDDDVKVPIKSQIKKLVSYFRGRVSYLKAQPTDVKKVFVGSKIRGIQHFKIFESGMSDFQTGPYSQALKDDVGEEEKSKKGVYSNSRQASLLVYPDGSYGSKGYKNYITEERRPVLGEKDKFIYSFSLTREFKNLFENKSYEQKYSELEKLSTKYASLVNILMTTPNESSFAYIDLVEGSGSIVLSKILEQFGFSKAKGGEKTPGLRYAIITNKTATTKGIKSIVKTFNSKENKHGDIIKLIIGSKVISEGITLKNVQNIHIITPFWNYSEIDQAIGRGIRAFSHKDLGRDVAVKVYHYAALPANNSKSIDVIMYKISEKKDISIKAMERVLKISAFDCELTKLRNIRDDPMTRECDYQSCDYQCNGITVDEYIKELDDSYNNLYLTNDLKMLSIVITNILSREYCITFEKLKGLLPEYTNFQILTCLNDLIMGKNSVMCSNGLKGFVYESDGYFYVSDKLWSKNYFDSYYIQNPTYYKKGGFDAIVKDQYLDQIPEKIELMIAGTNDERDIILSTLPLNIQEMFLEAAVLANKKKIKVNEGFQKYLLQYYKDFIKRYDTVTISSLLFDSKNELRCLEKEKWRLCGNDAEKLFKEEKDRKNTELENNPYGYYGIYNNDTKKFQIRDVSQQEYKETDDTRKETKGKVCSSWLLSDLVKMVIKLQMVLPPNIAKMSKDELLKILLDKKYKKKMAKIMGEDALKKLSKENLQRVYYYGTMAIKKLCEEIQDFFRKNNLLLIM